MSLLEIEEALERVLENARPLVSQRCELDSALGLVLAEAVVSDIDSPPHDKSIVDGYAVIAADLADACVELSVLEEITAGVTPTQQVVPGTASRIMTGAPIPTGADAVVMVEKTQSVSASHVRIMQSGVKPGQNIMRRAASLARGQTVLQPDTVLRGIELGLLAEVGCCQPLVYSRAKIAVLATGNELVEGRRIPQASQIRNSNGPMLLGLARSAGAEVLDLGIGRDEREHLYSACERGLEHEVLLISGGVSAGILDLVPSVLESLGVRCVFHKVNLKPGKPLWFGVRNQSLVFGLPGNPVSSLVCFELFVRPALERLMGRKPRSRMTRARLSCDFYHRGDRVTLFPAMLSDSSASLTATPLDWRGSGDLRTLTEAQCLIYFRVGERHYLAGDDVDVLRLEG